MAKNNKIKFPMIGNWETDSDLDYFMKKLPLVTRKASSSINRKDNETDEIKIYQEVLLNNEIISPNSLKAADFSRSTKKGKEYRSKTAPVLKTSISNPSNNITLIQKNLSLWSPIKNTGGRPKTQASRRAKTRTKSPKRSSSPYIDFIQSFTKEDILEREICVKETDNSSPLHISISSKPRTSSNTGQMDFQMNSPLYNPPIPIPPFCLGRRTTDQSPLPWRETQKLVFLWKSRYQASRIHENFLQDKLEMYHKKTLADFYPKKAPARTASTASAHYEIPNRYLPSEKCASVKSNDIIVSVPQDHLQDINILDFQLLVSDLRYQEKINAKYLQTTIENIARKEERKKSKLALQSREESEQLIRRLYKLDIA